MIEVISKTHEEINAIRDRLVRIDPNEVNIFPILRREELYIKASGEPMCVSPRSRISDLFPMALFMVKQ